MLNKIWGKINRGFGVDLGSTKTMIYQQDRGIVVHESSVVAVNNRTDQILAVGHEARKMMGKTPPHIIASAPLEHGIISDFGILYIQIS